ncbi:hypothetical protein AWC38_SpisGene14839 [Stylophora pistillata]|uniref:Uncharacterized protein n=1 Tax=Stylophora pistillata TaxID=50429 RepID=A0A2B4RV25_STYPI|nr:hypothetical protein AWC38_SpisGene14839 [Stylophora pistillata]
MRGRTLRRFQVYVPGDQKGAAIHRLPARPPPFIGSWAGRLSKRQSLPPTTVLLRTTLTRTIILHLHMLPPGSNHLLHKQTEFIDLTRSFVEVDLAFQTTGNGNLTSRANTDANLLSPVNNISHSLFKQINVKLNGTLITEQVDMYHLKAHIQTLLNFDREEGETILASAGWRNDIDSPETYTANNVKSDHNDYRALSANHKASVLTQKADARNYYAGGKSRVLRMVPFVDIFYQGKWLAPRTEMDLKFYLNPVALYFNAEDNPGDEEVRQYQNPPFMSA